jgi:hypothetical protein
MLLSPLPLTISLALGEKHISYIGPVWPYKVLMFFPVYISQIIIVLSKLPLPIVLLSYDMHTELTEFLWP